MLLVHFTTVPVLTVKLEGEKAVPDILTLAVFTPGPGGGVTSLLSLLLQQILMVSKHNIKKGKTNFRLFILYLLKLLNALTLGYTDKSCRGLLNNNQESDNSTELV